MKHTPGPWKVFNMVHADHNRPMTPEEIGEYVKNSVLVNPDNPDFLFVSCEKEDGPADVCHIGNGPDGPYNALLIQAAPDLLEAMQEFVGRVEKGEVRSKYTYTKFKEIISRATGQ